MKMPPGFEPRDDYEYVWFNEVELLIIRGIQEKIKEIVEDGYTPLPIIQVNGMNWVGFCRQKKNENMIQLELRPWACVELPRMEIPLLKMIERIPCNVPMYEWKAEIPNERSEKT